VSETGVGYGFMGEGRTYLELCHHVGDSTVVLDEEDAARAALSGVGGPLG